MGSFFANSHDFSIPNGTFNNVAGNQTVITYNYNNPSAGVHHSYATSGSDSALGSVRAGGTPYILTPTTPQYRDFLQLIKQIQDSLFPLREIASDAGLFGPLKGQLDELHLSASLACCITELLKSEPLFRRTFLPHINNRLHSYHVGLRVFDRDIQAYRQSLHPLLIGSFWRRIYSFILWSATSTDIQGILARMISEIYQFRKPLDQFLLVFKKNPFHAELESERHATFANLQGALSPYIYRLKDIGLDYIMVNCGAGGMTIQIPLLWCTSWKHISYVLCNCTIYPERNGPIFAEFLDSFFPSSALAPPTNGMTVVPVRVRYAVFFEDNPYICPRCRRVVHSVESPEGSFIQCSECDLEYTVCCVDRPEFSKTLSRSDSELTTNQSEQVDTFDLSQLPRRGLEYLGLSTPCLRQKIYYSNSWNRLVSSLQILDLRGTANELVDVFRHLALAQSPLKACSVHISPDNLLVSACNVIVPKAHHLSPDVSLHTKVLLPNLCTLKILAWGLEDPYWTVFKAISAPLLRSLDLQNIGCSLEEISLILEHFPLLEDLKFMFWPYLETHNRTAQRFIRSLSRAACLEHLSIQILFRGIQYETFTPFGPPDDIANQLFAARQTFGKLVTARFRYFALSRITKSAIASLTEQYYRHPWTVYVVDDDDHVILGQSCTAELHVDKLDSDYYPLDSYSFFADFLISNPFPCPEFDIYPCYRVPNYSIPDPSDDRVPTGDEKQDTVPAKFSSEEADSEASGDSEYESLDEEGDEDEHDSEGGRGSAE